MSKKLSFQDLINFLRANKDKKFLITFHSMGDRDGVGSAIALKNYLTKSTISTPDYITNSSKRMIQELSTRIDITNAFPSDVEGIIALDANNLEALGSFREKILASGKNLLFIDHHLVQSDEEKNATQFNDENYNSTASIIYEVLTNLGASIDNDAALALINGIISDSSEFHNMTSKTFKQLSELLEKTKLKYSEILFRFNEIVPVENRYSTFRDMSEAKAEIVSRYLLVYGKSSMHANIAADAAIKLGADAAIFWMENDKEVSISGRLKPSLENKLSIHLGKIMREVAPIIGGNGGGHPSAAGAYGPNKGELQKALNLILERIRQKMG